MTKNALSHLEFPDKWPNGQAHLDKRLGKKTVQLRLK